jgi:ClpX C4-type zinc finger
MTGRRGRCGWSRRDRRPQCSFCGLEARKVRYLVASGLSVPAGKFGDLPRICDRCRDVCLEILAETSPA